MAVGNGVTTRTCCQGLFKVVVQRFTARVTVCSQIRHRGISRIYHGLVDGASLWGFDRSRRVRLVGRDRIRGEEIEGITRWGIAQRTRQPMVNVQGFDPALERSEPLGLSDVASRKSNRGYIGPQNHLTTRAERDGAPGWQSLSSCPDIVGVAVVSRRLRTWGRAARLSSLAPSP
jgi:hypothetical protein